MPLPSSFYQKPVIQVAQELLGKKLVICSQSCWITETEAYGGKDDPASHAYKGPTPRSEIMFGPSGRVYVYLIYGMHHCLNIVTHSKGEAGAVLIRGIQIDNNKINGPGRVCKYLRISREHNHIDVTQSNDFFICNGKKPINISCSPRIGIRKAVDRLWRFNCTLP